MVTRVGILGARGYAALELIKILLRHPAADITVLTSRLEEQPRISEVHPQLAGRLDLGLEPFELDSVAGRVDVVFSCLPHAASAEVVCKLVDAGVRVIDFSADYRLDDIDIYEKWYEVEHPDPGRGTGNSYSRGWAGYLDRNARRLESAGALVPGKRETTTLESWPPS